MATVTLVVSPSAHAKQTTRPPGSADNRARWPCRTASRRSDFRTASPGAPVIVSLKRAQAMRWKMSGGIVPLVASMAPSRHIRSRRVRALRVGRHEPDAAQRCRPTSTRVATDWRRPASNGAGRLLVGAVCSPATLAGYYPTDVGGTRAPWNSKPHGRSSHWPITCRRSRHYGRWACGLGELTESSFYCADGAGVSAL